MLKSISLGIAIKAYAKGGYFVCSPQLVWWMVRVTMFIKKKEQHGD